MPFAFPARLKKLRAQVFPDGSLHLLDRRQKPIRPADDGWWDDVLSDPRASRPTMWSIPADHPDARYRLDRQRDEIWVACDCGRSRTVSRDDLIAINGAGANMLRLAEEIIDCGNRNKVTSYCRAKVLL